MSRPNAEIAAEIYAFFDYESAAAGRLDSLFERYAVPDLELEPPPIYPDMSVYRGLDEIRGFFQMMTEVWDEWTFEPTSGSSETAR